MAFGKKKIQQSVEPKNTNQPTFKKKIPVSSDEELSQYVLQAKNTIFKKLFEKIDTAIASKTVEKELRLQISGEVDIIVGEEKLRLNSKDLGLIIDSIIDDMLGLGPLEPLLKNPNINDILVNSPTQVFVEENGKLKLSNVKFRDNTHILNIATRIVSKMGRRIDTSVPLVDARLEDGSRVNIIIPPLAIDSPSISIRKFSDFRISLETMSMQNNLSKDMATCLQIAAKARLNIIISGGTGSGKTTLLNALSEMINQGERIITIEDAAELKLVQPHVVRLETRPANIEGKGEINQRDLVKNTLRMRPDRIILGEIRSDEAFDMLQAMNTGHDGSMSTIHANNPRDSIARLENMVSMAGFEIPAIAIRQQIVSAVDLIVQVNRMHDGKRRITRITEFVGMEEDVVVTQDLFVYKHSGNDSNGNMLGEFEKQNIKPKFAKKAALYGLEKELLQATTS
jgi:pilus assembly protein CpaF